MAHNPGYYPPQQQPQAYPPSQPQNIYQQLGKPQPQPHLQRHPTYQQSPAPVVQLPGGYPFSQQYPQYPAVPTSSSGSSWLLPASWPPAVAPSANLVQQAQPQAQVQVQPQASPQTPAQPPARRPLPQPLLPAAVSAIPQSISTTPWQSTSITSTTAPQSPVKTPARRQLPQPNLSAAVNAIPQSVPTISPIAPQTLAQTQAPRQLPQSFLPPAAGTIPKPISTIPWSSISSASSQNPAQTPAQRQLPQSSLPPAVSTISKSISTTPWSSTSTASAAAPQTPVQIPARKQLPQSSLTPTAIPKSTSTTSSSSTSTTSATTANSTSDTSSPPPKKFTPIWRNTIPDYPAPAWGYAVGMVGEAHPKPKTQISTQPTPTGAPPAAAAVQVKSSKQKKTVAVASPMPPVSRTKVQYEDDDVEEDYEDSEEETDSDEEDVEDDDEDDEEVDSRWDIRQLPASRRAGPASIRRYANNYENDEEEEEEDLRYRRAPVKKKKRSSIAKPTNRRGLPKLATGAGAPKKSVKERPRWKSTPLNYGNYDGGGLGSRRKLEIQYHPQEEMTRKFKALGMNDRTNLVDNQGSPGDWPANLPRLPKTPGSSLASGSLTNDGVRRYFDIRPQPLSITPSAPKFSGRQQLRSAGISGKMNISLDDSPPRATVIQSSLPSSPTLISRREPLPRPPQRPESQTYSTSDADDQIEDRFQHRRSLYSAPVAVQALKKRPQSQTYGSAATRMQAPIGSRNQQQQHQQHQFSQHPPFPNQIMHNLNHYQPQPAAPAPTIGIESPHPVGGRDKLADIPMLEEGSNNESEGENHQHLNHRRVQVPRINVASDPSSSSLPRIQVDGAGSGPSVPTIHVDSSPRMNGIDNGGGLIINVEPPSINITDGDSPRDWKHDHEVDNSPRVQVYEIPGVSVSDPDYGGPSINVSGPDYRNPQPHRHTQSAWQQSQFEGQQNHGSQARSAGGLTCGGCNGSIVGRIVSAMGSRWHPACFRCTVCNELLEHVSSYEHEGRPYCHLDYHENFAPRCYSCKTAIIEEQFISLDDPALGKRTYHTQHFFCAECGDPFLSPSVSFPDSKGEVALSGDGEFEGFTVYKGHPYCEACHVRLRLPKCKRCKRSIRDHDEAVEALGGKWCWGCFVCASCNEPFEDPSFFERDNEPFCERCFSIMLRNEV